MGAQNEDQEELPPEDEDRCDRYQNSQRGSPGKVSVRQSLQGSAGRSACGSQQGSIQRSQQGSVGRGSNCRYPDQYSKQRATGADFPEPAQGQIYSRSGSPVYSQQGSINMPNQMGSPVNSQRSGSPHHGSVGGRGSVHSESRAKSQQGSVRGVTNVGLRSSPYPSQPGSVRGIIPGRLGSLNQSPGGSIIGSQQGRFGSPAQCHQGSVRGKTFTRSPSPRSQQGSVRYAQRGSPARSPMGSVRSNSPRGIPPRQSPGRSPVHSRSPVGSSRSRSSRGRRSPAYSRSPARSARSGSSRSRSGSPRSPRYMQHIQSKATSTVPPRRFGSRSPRRSPRQPKPEAVKTVELPQFVRLKSQALCRYLMVHPSKKETSGKLLFCGKQDKTNPYYMFEICHVPGVKQACKIKSMATGKFWKRVPLNKVPECKSAITDGGFFSVILAKGDSEIEGDVFTYKKQSHEIGGLESHLISLWSRDDNKFVAPFCVIKDEKTGDVRFFLGCKPSEEKYNNTYYFHGIYHQHWHVTPDPVVSKGKYGFGF